MRPPSTIKIEQARKILFKTIAIGGEKLNLTPLKQRAGKLLKPGVVGNHRSPVFTNWPYQKKDTISPIPLSS